MWVQVIALLLRHERLHWVAATVVLMLALAFCLPAIAGFAVALKHI